MPRRLLPSEKNHYEARGRAAKVARFVAAFDRTVIDAGRNPETPDAAEEAVRQLQAATDAQWEQLAEDLGESKAPSPTARALIVAHYQVIANSRHAKNPETAEPGRERYVVAGDVGGRSYGVEAVNDDGRGFQWSLSIEGRFVRSGYTRGADVLKAFADARAAAEVANSGGDGPDARVRY